MAKIPQFASIEEESDFWDTHDSTDYLDDTEPVEVVFVDKRPKTQISLRLDPTIIEHLKQIATTKGMGYQTLLRMWVMERLKTELAAARAEQAENVKAAS